VYQHIVKSVMGASTKVTFNVMINSFNQCLSTGLIFIANSLLVIRLICYFTITRDVFLDFSICQWLFIYFKNRLKTLLAQSHESMGQTHGSKYMSSGLQLLYYDFVNFILKVPVHCNITLSHRQTITRTSIAILTLQYWILVHFSLLFLLFYF